MKLFRGPLKIFLWIELLGGVIGAVWMGTLAYFIGDRGTATHVGIPVGVGGGLIFAFPVASLAAICVWFVRRRRSAGIAWAFFQDEDAHGRGAAMRDDEGDPLPPMAHDGDTDAGSQFDAPPSPR
jgi:hypothetical protein